MTYKQPPRPRKRPKQSRSASLVASIQEACLKILTEQGSDALTTRRIADVAGVNIASVYQYFPNKEAILADLYENVIEQYAHLASKRFAEFAELSRESLEKPLAAFIELEAEQLLSLYELNPDFYTKYCQSYDVHARVNELTLAMRNPSWEDWFPRFLTRHKAALRPADIRTLSFVARNALLGNLQATVSEKPEMLRNKEFKAELLYQLLAYLLPFPRSISDCRRYF